MKTYNFFPHTADVRLKVEASSLEELFTAALEGMGNLIKKNECSENSLNTSFKEQIEISSTDSTALLIDFLSEVLTYTQVNKVIYCNVKFKNLTKNFLTATIFGNKVEKFDEDIKAVTYHEAEIKKNEDGNLETTIIFDI